MEFDGVAPTVHASRESGETGEQSASGADGGGCVILNLLDQRLILNSQLSTVSLRLYV